MGWIILSEEIDGREEERGRIDDGPFTRGGCMAKRKERERREEIWMGCLC